MRLLAIVISSLVFLAAAADAAEPKKPEGPAFVKLDAIAIPIYEGEVMTRQATIVLALELEEGRSEAEVAPQKPRLRDAFLTELTRIFEERAHEARLIDTQSMKPRLHETAERVLGPGIVKDVLVQQALERARRR